MHPGIAPILNGADDLPELTPDGGQRPAVGIASGPSLAIEPVGLDCVGPHGFGRDFRRHELVAQTVKDTGFQGFAGDRAAVVTTARSDVRHACVAVLPAAREGASAGRTATHA